MGEVAGQKYEIKCQACGARFRITSKSGAPPAGALPCPKCRKTISLGAEEESSWQNMGYEKVFGRTDAPHVAPAKPQRVFTDITAVGLEEATKPAEAETEVPEPQAPQKPAPRVFAAPAKLDPSSPISLDILEPTDVRSFLNEGSWGAEESVVTLEPEAEPKAEPEAEPEAEQTADEKPQKISRSVLRERLKKLPRPSSRTIPTAKPAEPELVLSAPDEPDVAAENPPAVEAPIAPTPVAPPRARPVMFDDAALTDGIEVRAEGVTFSKMRVVDIARVIQRGAWAGAIEVHDLSGEWFSLVLHPVFAHVEAELSAHTRAALAVVTAEVERVAEPSASISAAPELRAPIESHQEAQPMAQPPIVEQESPKIPPPMPSYELLEEVAELEEVVELKEEAVEEPAPFVLKAEYQPRPRMSATTILLGILVVMVTVIAAYILTHQDEKPLLPPIVEVAPTESIQLATLVERRATSITQGVAQLRAKTTEELSAAVMSLIQRKNYGDAWEMISELRTREPDNKEWVVREIEISLGSQEWSEARRQAVHALSRFEDPDIEDLYRRAVQNDARLFEKPITLTQTGDFDRIRALGGGRSVSLKFKNGDDTVYAFKPAQAEWGDGWKSEVAAWRLCELIACDFDVPWSRPARISRDDLMALYPLDNDKQRTYFERFSELTWVVEPGPDGVEREYLYGVQKTWVPHFADWPIEYTHIWQDWLSAEADPAVLETPLRQALRPLMLYKNGEYLRNILGEEGDATTRSVAKGLSEVVTFDYLTNNWDRFSILEQYYGVNNQFANGRFVSIDNGAAFHVQPSIRVDARFEPVQRFSRSFLRGLKLLQPSWCDPILFESSSDMDRQRLAVFWQRRDAVLGRVTELVEQHDEQKILFFD